LIGAPLAMTALLDMAGDGPSTESIGFGTGGSGCDLTGTGHSFHVGTPVHVVAHFSPDLKGGTK